MISTKGRYAIRVMLDLAEQAANENDGFIPLKDIAERQDISKKYLEIIVKELVVAELVDSASGKGGGYKLNRPADKYTLGQIIETMEGPLAPVACLADKKYKCKRKSRCKTLPLWAEYDKLTHDFFYSKKLSDLL